MFVNLFCCMPVYAGGPCGVLATVQAHLVGTLMEQVGTPTGYV